VVGVAREPIDKVLVAIRISVPGIFNGFLMKFFGGVGRGPSNNRLDSGVGPDQNF